MPNSGPLGFEDNTLEGGRQAARLHGRQRIQTCRPRLIFLKYIDDALVSGGRLWRWIWLPTRRSRVDSAESVALGTVGPREQPDIAFRRRRVGTDEAVLRVAGSPI